MWSGDGSRMGIGVEGSLHPRPLPTWLGQIRHESLALTLVGIYWPRITPCQFEVMSTESPHVAHYNLFLDPRVPWCPVSYIPLWHTGGYQVTNWHQIQYFLNMPHDETSSVHEKQSSQMPHKIYWIQVLRGGTWDLLNKSHRWFVIGQVCKTVMQKARMQMC